MQRHHLIPTVGVSPLQKILLLALVFGLIAYLTHSLVSLVIFGCLTLVMSLGRTVPLGALAAALLGACFPYVGLALVGVGTFFVLFTPTAAPSHSAEVPRSAIETNPNQDSG